uniref:CoA transferase n=1 Tax=Arthrobacter sp. 9E06 TaxID=2058890 RepID=UPI0015E1D144
SQTQDVHASLSGTGSFLQLPYLLDYEGAAHDEPSGPDAKGRGPLDRLYQAADRWIYLAAAPDQAPAIAAALGLDTLPEDDDVRAQAIQAKLLTISSSVAVEELVRHGIGAHVLLDLTEVMDSNYARRKGLVITRNHPGLGNVTLTGPSPRPTRTPAVPTRPGGPPGWDTRDVIEDLGYGDRFEDLIDDGVIQDGLPDGVQFVGLFR